jgi:hypothetical protein
VELGKASKSVFTVPLQLQTVAPVAPSIAPMGVTGATRGTGTGTGTGGPMRITGSKRPLGAVNSSAVTLAVMKGSPGPGPSNVQGQNPMHEGGAKRNKHSSIAPVNLGNVMTSLNHSAPARTSMWR